MTNIQCTLTYICTMCIDHLFTTNLGAGSNTVRLKILEKGRWKLTMKNGMAIVVNSTAVDAPDTQAVVPSGASNEIVLDAMTGASTSENGIQIEQLSDEEELVLQNSMEASGNYSSSSSEMCSGQFDVHSKEKSKKERKEEKKKATKKQSK